MTDWTPRPGDVVAMQVKWLATTNNDHAVLAPWMSRERQEALEALREAVERVPDEWLPSSLRAPLARLSEAKP